MLYCDVRREVDRTMDEKRNTPLVVEVDESTFDSEVFHCAQPVLVAFGAPWSRPCHILESTLDEVATACAGSVKLVKVNADDNPDLSICYEVESIPTLLFFIEGHLAAKVVGTVSKEAILARLRAVLDRGEATSPTLKATEDNEPRNE